MKDLKLYFIILPLLTLLFSPAHAQLPTQIVKGTLIDQASEGPVVGATVIVQNVTPALGAISDERGNFRIEKVPLGRHSLVVSAPGYATNTVANLVVNSGKEVVVTVKLEEKIVVLDAVTITGQEARPQVANEMATVSSRTFSVEEAARYSGSLQDPARMAQNYAGVSGASDDRNDIIIRGNSPTGVLWRMEGIDIPSPNHFASLGTTGGPVSMLNINNLRNSDFLTSAFPAEYGNALAGVFDLQLRKGNRDKYEFLGQVGFNGFEFGAEGPFKKGKAASFLANYRYSTLGLISALGVNLGTGAAIPQYQDLTWKIHLPTRRAGTFSFFGIGGLSNIEFLAESAGDNNLYSDQNQNLRFRSNTGIVGAKHTVFLDEKTYSRLVLSASVNETLGDIDSVSTQTEEEIDQSGFDRSQTKISANYKLNRKFNARNTANVGVIGDLYLLNILDTTLTPQGAITDLAFDGRAALVQSYVQWKHRFSERLTLNSGLHSQHFFLTNSHSIEPRLNLKYQAGEAHAFSLGSGLHSQMQPLPVYFVRDDAGQSANENVDFSRSIHSVLAYNLSISPTMRLRTEVYYQYLYNIPVNNFPSSFSMLNAGTDFVIPNETNLVNDGTGYNYGLELTLEKFYANGYYFLLTGSLFESRYAGSDGIERNTAFNGNYVVNALAGTEVKLSKTSTLFFDTKATIAGGRRFTPISLARSREVGFEVRDENLAFSEQFDPYFRADFKVGIRMNMKNWAQQFQIDIQNIANYQNVFQFGYNPRTQQVGTVYQRGLFPDVQYKVFF
ncbi:MAG: TonB-dependent receptor [Bacteroidota bacterium]